jgi:hypothetical protein
MPSLGRGSKKRKSRSALAEKSKIDCMLNLPIRDQKYLYLSIQSSKRRPICHRYNQKMLNMKKSCNRYKRL